MPSVRSAKVLRVNKEYTRIQDEIGEIHVMINGSLNSVPSHLRKVGKEGEVIYEAFEKVGYWRFREREDDADNQ